MRGGDIGYKKWDKEFNFADLVFRKSLEHNRSLKMMNRISKVVNWSQIFLSILCDYCVCPYGPSQGHHTFWRSSL